MRAGRIIGVLFGLALVVLGLLFLVSGAHPLVPGRPIVGFVLIGGGIALVWATRARPVIERVEVTRRIELTGDVSLESFKCRQCGGTLSEKNVSMSAGAVMVKCPYCAAAYQIEEAPKW